MFGGVIFPDGTYAIDEIEGLIEHQKLFMETISEVRVENMFTFPVLTYSLLKRDDITIEEQQHMLETHDWNIFVDNDFARWCSDHNMLWNDSNFFMSDNVGTLSNCCFDGSQKCLVLKDFMSEDNLSNEEMKITFEELYEALERKDQLISIYSSGYFVYGRMVRLPRRKMYKITTESGAELIVTDNHIFPTYHGEDKQANELTTDDLLVRYDRTTSDEVPDKITYVMEYASDNEFVYCFEMCDPTDPYFTLANGIVSHNCRLLSDTKKLDAFINSIGGTALSIGSVKVNTINLMRIALESNHDEEEFLRILEERATLCCKVLDVIRHIITRNVQKGLLPNYVDGGIDISKQYSTIGILATYEAVKEFGYIKEDEFGSVSYTDEGIDFASRIFKVLNYVKDRFNDVKTYWIRVDLNDDQYKDIAEPYSFNIESVPRHVGTRRHKLDNPSLGNFH